MVYYLAIIERKCLKLKSELGINVIISFYLINSFIISYMPSREERCIFFINVFVNLQEY